MYWVTRRSDGALRVFVVTSPLTALNEMATMDGAPEGSVEYLTVFVTDDERKRAAFVRQYRSRYGVSARSW